MLQRYEIELWSQWDGRVVKSASFLATRIEAEARLADLWNGSRAPVAEPGRHRAMLFEAGQLRAISMIG